MTFLKHFKRSCPNIYPNKFRVFRDCSPILALLFIWILIFLCWRYFSIHCMLLIASPANLFYSFIISIINHNIDYKNIAESYGFQLVAAYRITTIMKYCPLFSNILVMGSCYEVHLNRNKKILWISVMWDSGI